MTEFEDLELAKEVPSMEEDEAKETLSEFMEAHQKNQNAYDELKNELDETETEYEQKLEEKEELISDFKEERAEEAAEYVKMPAGLLAERFSFSELDQIIEEGTEYTEPDEDEENEDENTLTTFVDREEKGQTDSGTSKYRSRAARKMNEKGIPVQED